MDDQTVEAGVPGGAAPALASGRTEYRMPSDDGLRLVDVWSALRRRSRLVLLVTSLCTAVSVLYAVLATPTYRATAVIVPPQQRESGLSQAAASLFGGTAGDLAQQLGFLKGAADANRLEALLLSRRLLSRVIKEHDLLPILFPKLWDSASGTWKSSDRDKIPDMWDAEKELEKIYKVKYDVKAGVIRLSFDLYEPSLAAKVLQHYLGQLALIVQADEVARISANMQFIREQLGTATDPSVIARLQSLLSTEVENAMMAQNLERVAFTVLDPPTASTKKVKPKRAIISAFGFTTGVLVGCLAAILRDQTESMVPASAASNS